MDVISKYFPSLSVGQVGQFAALGGLYADWNAKINVISRKDLDGLYEHHVLHSLAIACWESTRLQGAWNESTRVVDVGTGGGFPGIPLAIVYPQVQFLLVDRIGKKVRVAQAVADAIGLQNVVTRHAGIEEVKESFDYVVSRAVMPLPDLLKACRHVYARGLVCLKGGDLTDEVKRVRAVRQYDISTWFDEPFFESKQVIYVPK